MDHNVRYDKIAEAVPKPNNTLLNVPEYYPVCVWITTIRRHLIQIAI